jgi:N-acetylmuramoyl-L-alanine amidase
MQASLRGFGYGLAESGTYDAATEVVVMAFQRHFRPARVDGIADPSTLETLDRVIAMAGV